MFKTVNWVEYRFPLESMKQLTFVVMFIALAAEFIVHEPWSGLEDIPFAKPLPVIETVLVGDAEFVLSVIEGFALTVKVVVALLCVFRVVPEE